MDGRDKETNDIEASGGKDDTKRSDGNNNFEKVETVKKSSRRDDDSEGAEKRRKFCPQYIYQHDYKEALRSLLWEPYDCRDDIGTWYCRGLVAEKVGALTTSEVPEQMSPSSSESSISSSSDRSSFEEFNLVEAKPRSASDADGWKAKECKTRAGRTTTGKWGREAKRQKTMVTSALLIESKVDKEEEPFREFSESVGTSDPVRNEMDVGMVSDLDSRNEYGMSSTWNGRTEAQQLRRTEIGASASQCECDRSAEGHRSCNRGKGDLNAPRRMLVTVEGTLEPRDSNEGTRLVSPDTSLDPNDNPVPSHGPNGTPPGPSSGNVSVVNCYRAVPVSVVSTVPTIKCLNTQGSVSCNVNIIQTSSDSDQKMPPVEAPQKRRNVRSDTNGPTPGTSRVRTIMPPNESNKCQSRPGVAPEQNQVMTCAKIERPRRAAACRSEIQSEPTGETPSNQNTATESTTTTNNNNIGSIASNHNRSVSSPVSGNQAKSPQNRWAGSQQNLPVRLETHFGPSSPGGAERPQTFLLQRSTTDVEASGQQQQAPDECNPTGVAKQPSPRTFTSTEAQTDDVPLDVHSRSAASREQRRRERRERRHQRRFHQSVLNSGSVWQTNVDIVPGDRRGLPDILNSHMPPPYSAVSISAMPTMPPPMHVPPPATVPAAPQMVDSPAGQPLPHQNSFRFPFPFPGGGRRGDPVTGEVSSVGNVEEPQQPEHPENNTVRTFLRTSEPFKTQSQVFAHEEETPKSCCGVVVTQTVSIRWFIVMISFVGICCVIVGTVLGAMKASGREHLTVSLLMIGVGIVLVTVSVVAWRLTSQDAPSCRSMLGLSNAEESGNEPNQRFVPRMPPSYGRPHHPYAAMMYPEFQYRPPPPSYQASMQEYRLRLLLLERPNDTTAGLQAAMSPPPTYRSQAGSTLGLRAPPLCRSLPQSEYSHPPSYRSRTSSTRPTLDPNGDTSVNHSRNSSLLSHVSDQNGNVSQAVVNVISVMGNTVDLRRGDTELQIDSIKLGVDEEVPIPPLRMFLNKGKRSPSASLEETKSENVNLVTIVTVSDNNTTPNRDHSVESDVLAHL